MAPSNKKTAATCLLGMGAMASAQAMCDFTCSAAASLTDPTVENNFCPNPWNADVDGFTCMTVAADGASFEADWAWGGGAPYMVHSFPHIVLNAAQLPAKISDMTAANIAIEWGMGPNTTTKAGAGALSVDEAGIAAASAMGTVAFDLWLDEDPDTASSDSKAAYEIMIWLGRFGTPIPQPLAPQYPAVAEETPTIGGEAFSLYVGKNKGGQTVCSFVLDKPTSNFKIDANLLIQHLVKMNHIPPTVYLGSVQFGIETFYTTETMAFLARGYSLDLKGSFPVVSSTLPSTTTGVLASTAAGITTMVTPGSNSTPTGSGPITVFNSAQPGSPTGSVQPKSDAQSVSAGAFQLFGFVAASWAAVYSLGLLY